MDFFLSLSLTQVFLVLSGSDYRVHLYCEDSVTHMAQEKSAMEYFPEFADEFPSVALWIEFHLIPDKSRRLTAVGCECGTLFLFIVDLKTNWVVNNERKNLGSSITSAKFFKMDKSVHLLVTNALLPASVYQ